MKLRRLLLAAVLAVSPIAALAQQVQTGVSPPPPVGASPPYAPLGGCVYMPNGVALTGYVGPMGLTCGANGGLNVNVLAGGGGGGGAADQTGTNATDGQATSTNNQHSIAFNYIFNGSTWDRWRGAVSNTTGSTANSAPVSIGTTATQIAAAATGLVSRIYQNNGTAPVYVGGSSVTTTSGITIQPGQTYDFSRLSGAFYGIAASATQAGSLIQY